jgi:uncharacterized membrane protein YeaQ/YmgE (transglycosylase-associated protein family)
MLGKGPGTKAEVEIVLTAIIVTLVVGAIAGWLAGLLVQGSGFGLLGDIVVGILGALFASWLFPMFGLTMLLGGGMIGAIFTAFLGAVVLLLIVGLIRKIAS